MALIRRFASPGQRAVAADEPNRHRAFQCVCHYLTTPLYKTLVSIQGRARVEKSILKFNPPVVLMLPELTISAIARILTTPDEVLTTYIDASRPIYKI